MSKVKELKLNKINKEIQKEMREVKKNQNVKSFNWKYAWI